MESEWGYAGQYFYRSNDEIVQCWKSQASSHWKSTWWQYKGFRIQLYIYNTLYFRLYFRFWVFGLFLLGVIEEFRDTDEYCWKKFIDNKTFLERKRFGHSSFSLFALILIISIMCYFASILQIIRDLIRFCLQNYLLDLGFHKFPISTCQYYPIQLS